MVDLFDRPCPLKIRDRINFESRTPEMEIGEVTFWAFTLAWTLPYIVCTIFARLEKSSGYVG
jgi:hypothetical protein